MAGTRRLPPAAWLLTFEAVARHRSFSRAARALGTSQPAASQRVLHLEAELGLALLRRLPRGVAPTEEGSRLLAALDEGFGRIEEALEGARAAAAGRAARLTVSTDFGFAAFWLLPRLGSLAATAPGIEVRVLTTQAEPDLGREPAVDLAIAFGDGRWPGCAAEPLLPEAVLPVAAPALLRPPPRTPAELAALPLIHLEAAAPGRRRWLDWPAWLAAAGGDAAPPPGDGGGRGLALDNYILVLQAAVAGQGVALGWRPLVDDLLATGQLVAALDREVRSGCGYHLVRPRGRSAGRAAALFEGWLRRQLTPAGRAAPPPASGAAP